MMSPLTLNAADKYLREKGIPVVGGDGAHGLWFESPVLFFPGPSYTALVVATAKYAVKIKTSKIAMFYCAEASPCQVARDALHQLAGQGEGTRRRDRLRGQGLPGPAGLHGRVPAGESGAPTPWPSIVDAAATSRATRSCIQQGYRPQWLTSPLTSAEAGDPNNEGMMNPVATFPWFSAETPAQKLFHAAVRSTSRTSRSPHSSVVWVAGQMLKARPRTFPRGTWCPPTS